MGLGSWIRDRVSDVADVVTTIARTPAVFAQGVVRGVASGVAVIGDAAVMGYNVVAGTDHNFSLADRAAEAVTLDVLRPRNDAERAAYAIGRGVGEVGAFVGLSVVTMGAGGAIVGGSVAATRGAVAVARMGQAARWANPLASGTTATIEAGMVGYTAYNEFNADRDGAEMAAGLAADGIAEGLDERKSELETLSQRREQILSDMEALVEDFEAGSAPHDFDTRFEDLQESLRIIEELGPGSELSDEQKQQRYDRLNMLHPSSADEASLSNDGTTSMLLSRANDASITDGFADGIAGIETPDVTPEAPDRDLTRTVELA